MYKIVYEKYSRLNFILLIFNITVVKYYCDIKYYKLQ